MPAALHLTYATPDPRLAYQKQVTSETVLRSTEPLWIHRTLSRRQLLKNLFQRELMLFQTK